MSQKKTKSIHRFYPMALTISGSDSGGGSGIEADLRTFNAYGVYACCAITAIASRNPRRITRIDQMPQESVKSQIDTVMECFSPAFVKSGMLGRAEIVREAALAVKKYKLRLICDPVMCCSSGSGLRPAEAVEVLKNELLPQAEWITPGVEEAEILLKSVLSEMREKLCSTGLSVYLGGAFLFNAVCKSVLSEILPFKLPQETSNVPPSSSHSVPFQA